MSESTAPHVRPQIPGERRPLLSHPRNPSMSDLAIDIRNVVKRYEQHVAVRDLSLSVPRGTVYGLLGPNGAGKTTTIRMILDIIRPDTGSDHGARQPQQQRQDARPRRVSARRAWPLQEDAGAARADVSRRAQGREGRRREQAHRRVARADSSLSSSRQRTGATRRSTSCRAACSRRCSSSPRYCTTRSS